MKNNTFCILAEDDSEYLRACYDELNNFFKEKDIELFLCNGIKDINLMIQTSQSKNDLILAILDLWFIDKEKNRPNEKEGFEILKLLRQRWPNSYIIILSSHIDDKVNDLLNQYSRITIIEKPYPPIKLSKQINNLFNRK